MLSAIKKIFKHSEGGCANPTTASPPDMYRVTRSIGESGKPCFVVEERNLVIGNCCMRWVYTPVNSFATYDTEGQAERVIKFLKGESE